MNSGRSMEEAMTMTFVSLVLMQFFKAYNFRSDRHSVFNRPFENKWLNLAVGWETAPAGGYCLPAVPARSLQHLLRSP
jgi:Ca2+-transporting ATPase